VTLRVECVEDTAALVALRGEWDALLGSSACNRLFLSWEWLHAWWRHLGGARRLFVLAARRGPQLVGLAPLALAPPGVARLVPFHSLEFLGSGSVGSDYLDLIVRPGCEDDVLRALADRIDRAGFVLQLAQLLRGRSLAEQLAARLTPRGWSRQEARTDVCPYIDIQGQTWDSYLASLGTAHRYNLQRRLRNLQRRYAVEFRRVTVEEDRGPALSRLIGLHHARWRERGVSEAFYSPCLVSFHEALSREALARGWLRLFELRLDGTTVASLYGFRYGDVFSFYQSGFDPRHAKDSVGLVTMGLAIKSAIEEGATEFDLLHGQEAYKFQWAAQARELARVELYPPLLRGLLWQQTVALGRAARRTVRRVLPRPLADRLAAGLRPS
jgi:CelD/BcsL family acetyltransferase involved in cellulose biosynthesis